MLEEFINVLGGFIRNHGKFIRIWLANQLIFILVDPKDIEVWSGECIRLP